MKWKRLVVVIGVIGVAGFAMDCPDQKVRDYLSVHGGPNAMYDWETYVNAHLCLLEKYSTVPIPERKCTQVPPSVTPPPHYPP